MLYRTVSKWLLKVITRLQLLCFLIGFTMLHNIWKPYEKQNQSHLVQRMWLYPHIEQVRGNDSRNSDSSITLFALVVVGQSGNNLKVLDSLFETPLTERGYIPPPQKKKKNLISEWTFHPQFSFKCCIFIACILTLLPLWGPRQQCLVSHLVCTFHYREKWVKK